MDPQPAMEKIKHVIRCQITTYVGSSHLDRFCGLVHPSFLSGRLAPTNIPLKSPGWTNPVTIRGMNHQAATFPLVLFADHLSAVAICTWGLKRNSAEKFKPAVQKNVWSPLFTLWYFDSLPLHMAMYSWVTYIYLYKKVVVHSFLYADQRVFASIPKWPCFEVSPCKVMALRTPTERKQQQQQQQQQQLTSCKIPFSCRT